MATGKERACTQHSHFQAPLISIIRMSWLPRLRVIAWGLWTVAREGDTSQLGSLPCLTNRRMPQRDPQSKYQQNVGPRSQRISRQSSGNRGPGKVRTHPVTAITPGDGLGLEPKTSQKCGLSSDFCRLGMVVPKQTLYDLNDKVQFLMA